MKATCIDLRVRVHLLEQLSLRGSFGHCDAQVLGHLVQSCNRHRILVFVALRVHLFDSSHRFLWRWLISTFLIIFLLQVSL